MLRRICAGLIALVVLAVSSPLAMAEPVPTWDNVIENPTRFKILADFAGQAVLDRETGLVWQRSPSTMRIVNMNTLRRRAPRPWAPSP